MRTIHPFKLLLTTSATTLILLTAQGCFLTKVVTVPMRVGGAVISVVPMAGNQAHEAIDDSAEIIDEIPF